MAEKWSEAALRSGGDTEGVHMVDNMLFGLTSGEMLMTGGIYS